MEDIEDGKENDKIDERRGKSWFSEDNNTTNEQSQTNPLRLIYSVDDDPSLGMSFLLGLQQYLTTVGGIFSIPFLLCPALCILNEDPSRGYIMSTIFIISGIATLLQTTFGVRLPIIQGSSITYVACTLAILNLPRWECPNKGDLYAMGHENRSEEWMMRMREIQGAVIVASLAEVVVGYLGLVGIILRYITPLTVTSTITLVGLSLVSHGIELSSGNWYISLTTVALLAIFSQYLRNVNTKLPIYTLVKGWHLINIKGFQLFPVLLTTIIVYFICYLLTRFDLLDDIDPARIDGNINIIDNTDWFRAPYPFQWGWPTFTISSIFAMFTAVLVGIIESVGDYYACARICGQPTPPIPAINRGIGTEGFSCILAGCMGIGTGVTSFSENIGAIGVTRVGSRKVIQCGAIIMIILAFFGKVAATFSTIPTPVVGGLLCVLFSIITAGGLTNLSYVNMSSTRNMFVLGSSLFFGIGLPQYLKHNEEIFLITGFLPLDQLVRILLSTPMFIGGFIGFILDNTIPGTPEEKGILEWKKEKNLSGNESADSTQSKIYKLPKFKFYTFKKFKEEVTSLLRRSK
ncbi:purine permease, putative [Pediculus humanus corporis]|uniref:Purine permease, putative n=1 Tax=Pediculus humanus subsp. corporis TaxID=121224 RepID=E0VTK0_PEDHC|nr:purine permease, putative [Pediculus humanus corporis]EEB16727.1 purine permease, putative [Pediculus humanus corporis]